MNPKAKVIQAFNFDIYQPILDRLPIPCVRLRDFITWVPGKVAKKKKWIRNK